MLTKECLTEAIESETPDGTIKNLFFKDLSLFGADENVIKFIAKHRPLLLQQIAISINYSTEEFIEVIRDKAPNRLARDLFLMDLRLFGTKKVIEFIAEHHPLLLQQIVIALSIKCAESEKIANKKM